MTLMETHEYLMGCCANYSILDEEWNIAWDMAHAITLVLIGS